MDLMVLTRWHNQYEEYITLNDDTCERFEMSVDPINGLCFGFRHSSDMNKEMRNVNFVMHIASDLNTTDNPVTFPDPFDEKEGVEWYTKLGVYQLGSFISTSELVYRKWDSSVDHLTSVTIINKEDVKSHVGCQTYPYDGHETEDDCLFNVSDIAYTVVHFIYAVYISVHFCTLS